MNRRTFAPLAVILILVTLVVACGKSEKTPAVSTTPIAELIQAGKPPVVVGSLSRGISPMPTFTMSLTNISDCNVQSVMGTVLFFDKDDKFLPESKTDTGYSELASIKPGEKIELQTMTNDDNAVSGKWIIKEVIYLKMNPVDKILGEIPYKWTNKNYEAELAAATATR